MPGDRARCDARRKAGEEEGVALVGRHPDETAAHLSRPAAHPHVRVDDLPVESQDLEVEEEIEVESRKENSAHRASGDVVHLGLPVLLQPDDVVDAVARRSTRPPHHLLRARLEANLHRVGLAAAVPGRGRDDHRPQEQRGVHLPLALLQAGCSIRRQQNVIREDRLEHLAHAGFRQTHCHLQVEKADSITVGGGGASHHGKRSKVLGFSTDRIGMVAC
jgi:hypothetical protein